MSILVESANISLQQAQQAILNILPKQYIAVARLASLQQKERLPVVTVVGKYNHGKSRLLNELIGEAAFSVADKRETVDLNRHNHEGVTWLDAPGLDADVAEGDDRHAERAIWLEADIRLMVHAAKEGELDATEAALMRDLQHNEQLMQRRTLFVLTQIDQVASDESLQKILAELEGQMAEQIIYPVSSVRHRKGIEQDKPLFVEKSGFPQLRQALAEALAHVPQARHHEKVQLHTQLSQELTQHNQACQRQLQHLQERVKLRDQGFAEELTAMLIKADEDLQEIYTAPEVDHAMDVDDISQTLQWTRGKQERSRVHIAYSRACIQIRTVLAKYGNLNLPKAQQVESKALSTVMVAVMGVSLKNRHDLQRLFSEEGRVQLFADFYHYYELSDDYQALQKAIAAAQAAVQACEQAIAALTVFKV
ncbi:MAG: 50S ribosome-binding GTPase [Pelistega sp.]|nr:50S ribosome-binding GTPase [Pelistega sp.]